MSLLVDLFGYLSIVLHGLTIVAQSMALGAVFFLVFLARPLGSMVGPAGRVVARDTVRIAGIGAIGLILTEAAALGLQAAVLTDTVGLSLVDVLDAEFALAMLAKMAAAALIAFSLGARGVRTPAWLLLPLAAIVLVAAALGTHAAARLEHRDVLVPVEALHQLGAAIWIGGLPAFVLALRRVRDMPGLELVGSRFSGMSVLGVSCILASGTVMAIFYVGEPAAFYGTAYGVMVGAKIAMFGGLLLLGLGNFLVVARLRAGSGAPVGRLRRFAEVEIAVGFTVFFAASSLISVPPAVDLTADRVSWGEVVERNTPHWPRLTSPERDTLTLPTLQAKLDAEAAEQARTPPPAFVPGSGIIPARNANDIAWSEYNHHWSGLFVLAIGLMALLNQAGLRAARHWPLLLLGLAAFLFVRSDPEVWPLGREGFFESLRDVEVLQHRMFVLLVIAFGLFEWRVRAFGWGRRRAALVFPLLVATGSVGLLTHTHAIANIKDQLLIELTHTPLALLGLAAAVSRWLELRLEPPANRWMGWIWPSCFLLIGALLVLYREV